MSKDIKGIKISGVCVFYAYMIIDGNTDFDSCPNSLKNDTAYVLVSCDKEELITDETIRTEAIERYNEACKSE